MPIEVRDRGMGLKLGPEYEVFWFVGPVTRRVNKLVDTIQLLDSPSHSISLVLVYFQHNCGLLERRELDQNHPDVIRTRPSNCKLYAHYHAAIDTDYEIKPWLNTEL
jgi:hypothetical protein